MQRINTFARGKEVQKKWKNSKDCFARELTAQRKTVSGQAAKKRRKYICFDQLLFLLPSMQDRATSGNIAPSQNNSENEGDQDTSTILQSNTENNENIQFTHVHVADRIKEKVTPYVTKLLRILEQKKSDEIDEDKHFALMLVPMLKKLTDD
ncbi:hypothetical protein FQR65_LT17676 [Abscondita terminalis]|nr:hypothetical protein FQR65_LT17676 [Abscondita terminalis]